MKSEFLQPKFEGARFAEHTLPLDVARDLAAYETLVIELAKQLYLKDHPERQRVLRGFAADFQLHLERVDDGSSKPLLSMVVAGALALGAGTNNYFERSRDLITACIAAPDTQLPAEFPRELLFHFNQVGKSLREGERMELPGEGTTVAILTPERRKKLVLAADKVYERQIELSGTIEEADWGKSTFRLCLTDGTRVVIPMPDAFHAQARMIGGRDRFQVTVEGTGAFDSWDKLQKVVLVDSLEVQPNYQLASRFDELRILENGWHNGEGVALEKSKLDAIAARMIAHYPETIPLPVIVPTQDGNLLLEWTALGDPSVDLNLFDLKADFHAFDPKQGDIDQEFNLSHNDDWSRFFGFLAEKLEFPPV